MIIKNKEKLDYSIFKRLKFDLILEKEKLEDLEVFLKKYLIDNKILADGIIFFVRKNNELIAKIIFSKSGKWESLEKIKHIEELKFGIDYYE